MLSLGRKVGRSVELRWLDGSKPAVRITHDENHIPRRDGELPEGVTEKVILGVLHLKYGGHLASVRVSYHAGKWRMQFEASERIAIIRV